MTMKCYNKPNRTKRRKFTEKSAGSIVCRVLNEGGNLEELRMEVSKCVDFCEHSKINAVLPRILTLLAAITLALEFVLPLLLALRVASLFLSRIPIIARLLSRVTTSPIMIEDALLKAKDITAQVEIIRKITGGL